MNPRQDVRNRIETLRSFLSNKREIHSFGVGAIVWYLCSGYVPGARFVVAILAALLVTGQYAVKRYQDLVNNVVDPAKVPDDIRKEPHYFLAGIALVEAAILVASLL